MKIRTGFVSNSSSSSFVCEVCGDTFESYNEGIAHFSLVMCKDRDHLFCDAHRINPIMDKDYNETYTMYEADAHGDGDDRIDSIHCPICQLKVITEGMMLAFALKMLDTNVTELKTDIVKSFKNCDEFNDFISGKIKNKYNVEVTARISVDALSEDAARDLARKMVVQDPMKLDVTHIERK